MRRLILVMLLILSVLLNGCRPMENQSIEKIGIITARGVDLEEEKRIETTLSYYEFEKDIATTKVVTGVGDTLHGAMRQANFESDFRLGLGKLQIELYGAELAQKGINPYIDTLSRDANLPDTMFLAVSKTTANDILMTQDQNSIKVNVGQYLYDLIDRNAKLKVFPNVTFTQFIMALHDHGKDPILPLFDINDQNIPQLIGMAAFSDDKYVGDLPTDYIILFNLLQRKIRAKNMETTLPIDPFKSYLHGERSGDHLNTAYNIISSDRKINLVDEENLKFDVNVKLNLNLLETSEQLPLHEEKVINILEKELNKHLSRKYREMLTTLKEYQSDPIGFGDVYRMKSTSGQLSKSAWRKMYQDIDVSFNIKANVILHGEHD